MSEIIKMNANWDDLRAKKKWLDAYIGKAVTKMVNVTSLQTVRHIKQDLFGVYPEGTTGSTLSTRSGKLKKAVTTIPAKREGDVIQGGIAIGSAYARVHFGKRGQVTTIIPKSAGALTIPLPAALDSHGVPRGRARDKAIFGETFLLPGKATKSGDAIICGKLLYVKGKKAGQAKTGIVPLFVLKKQVRVPVRVTNEDIRAYVQPLIGKGMADIKEGLEGSSVYYPD